MLKTVTIRQAWSCTRCLASGEVEVENAELHSTVLRAIVDEHFKISPTCELELQTSEISRKSA